MNAHHRLRHGLQPGALFVAYPGVAVDEKGTGYANPQSGTDLGNTGTNPLPNLMGADSCGQADQTNVHDYTELVIQLTLLGYAATNDIRKREGELVEEFKKKGINLIEVDRNAFRDALRKTSFYKDWKGKYGDEAWNRLEAATGKLA